MAGAYLVQARVAQREVRASIGGNTGAVVFHQQREARWTAVFGAECY